MKPSSALAIYASYTVVSEPFEQPPYLKGLRLKLYDQEQLVGEACFYLAPKGLRGETLLAFLDAIELLAVELFDVAQDQKRVAKQIEHSPFAYLTDIKLYTNESQPDLESFLLERGIEILKTMSIPNLYFVMVANTKKEHQHLHRFYMHHYFTYLIPQHPDKPAVLHRLIEV